MDLLCNDTMEKRSLALIMQQVMDLLCNDTMEKHSLALITQQVWDHQWKCSYFLIESNNFDSHFILRTNSHF